MLYNALVRIALPVLRARVHSSMVRTEHFCDGGAQCEKTMGYPKGKIPSAPGHPIGASSIPVGMGISKGNSVLLCLGCSEGMSFPFDRKNPKKPAVSWHTTFHGKSSVLYLCSRLTSERGWLCHLLYGQIAAVRHSPAAVGQADFVRTRTKCGFAYREKSNWPEKGAKVYINPSSRRSVTL